MSLKKIRIMAGLSQQRLADLSGVSRMTIYQMERGAMPKVSTAKKVAEVLDVNWEDIYKTEEQEEGAKCKKISL